MEGKKILLVEDDNNLAFAIKDNLEEHGFTVVRAGDGLSGYEAYCKSKIDICVLDIMLPGKDGYALAADIRKADEQVPIVFLTAKSLPADKIKGLKLGADDYITKPFQFEELALRIEAILKRSGNTDGNKVKRDFFKIGNYSFDFPNLELRMGNSSRTLTKKEAGLLRLLCIHQEKLLEREAALRIVWGENDYFLGRSMDVFIARLRKYLKDDPRIQIVNVRGVGFRLTIENAK